MVGRARGRAQGGGAQRGAGGAQAAAQAWARTLRRATPGKRLPPASARARACSHAADRTCRALVRRPTPAARAAAGVRCTEPNRSLTGVRTLAAYVLPRYTRRSNMMFCVWGLRGAGLGAAHTRSSGRGRGQRGRRGARGAGWLLLCRFGKGGVAQASAVARATAPARSAPRADRARENAAGSRVSRRRRTGRGRLACAGSRQGAAGQVQANAQAAHPATASPLYGWRLWGTAEGAWENSKLAEAPPAAGAALVAMGRAPAAPSGARIGSLLLTGRRLCRRVRNGCALRGEPALRPASPAKRRTRHARLRQRSRLVHGPPHRGPSPAPRQGGRARRRGRAGRAGGRRNALRRRRLGRARAGRRVQGEPGATAVAAWLRGGRRGGRQGICALGPFSQRGNCRAATPVLLALARWPAARRAPRVSGPLADARAP